MAKIIPPSSGVLVFELMCRTAAGSFDTTQTYSSTGLSALVATSARTVVGPYSSSATTCEDIASLSSPASPSVGKIGFKQVGTGSQSTGCYVVTVRADEALSNVAGYPKLFLTTSAGQQDPVGVQMYPVPAVGVNGLNVLTSIDGDGTVDVGTYGLAVAPVQVASYASAANPVRHVLLSGLLYVTDPSGNIPASVFCPGATLTFNAPEYENANSGLTTGPFRIYQALAGLWVITADSLADGSAMTSSTLTGTYGSNGVGAWAGLAPVTVRQTLGATVANQTNQATTGQATDTLALLNSGTMSTLLNGTGSSYDANDLGITVDNAAMAAATWAFARGSATVSGSMGETVASIWSRLGAWTGTGINTVLGAFIALFSKLASKPSDITGTMDPTTDSLEAIRDRGDAAWVGSATVALTAEAQASLVADLAAAVGGAGSGDTLVDHDFGGTDALQITDPQGAGIGGVAIRAYLKSEYDAGLRQIEGQTVTTADGRWAAPLHLEAGETYVLVFAAAGYSLANQEITCPS